MTPSRSSGPLVLRHASKRVPGTLGPGRLEHHVTARDIGPILRRALLPEDWPGLFISTGALALEKAEPASAGTGALVRTRISNDACPVRWY
jgi:hypothetical protein